MRCNNFNIHEERLYLKILENVQPFFAYKTSFEEFFEKNGDLKDHIVEIRVKDLMTLKGKKYRSIEMALDSIMAKKIKMEGFDKQYGKYKICSSLILEYKYFLQKKFVKIKISGSMLAYLCSALSAYTRYSLRVAFSCSSPYTSRIYQYISHWRDKKSGFVINFLENTVRDILELKGKYKSPTAVKNEILISASRELKNIADVWFEIVSNIKESRKVIGWKIQIFRKEESPHKKFPLPIFPEKTLSEVEQKLFDRLTAKFRLAPRQASKVVKFFGTTTEENRRKINQKLYDTSLRLINKLRPIENIGGYMADWFNREFKELLKI